MSMTRCARGILSLQACSTRVVLGEPCHAVQSPRFVPVMSFMTSASLRAEPRKKKKVDPKREQVMRDRLRKKLKRLEKVPPEMIPIEDFITPSKYMEQSRIRPSDAIPLEESERRALLLKEWCRYKQEQHMAEMRAINAALEAQREALEELRVESEELYRAALKPDPLLFPFAHEGPAYTPPKKNYDAPDGKYTDITKKYTM